MKKLATLIAGMLLVGGTMMAAEWTYNGKVEWEAFKINNNQENMEVMPDGGQWYMLEIGSQVTEQTKVTLKYDTDDDATDANGALTITHTPNEYLEIAVKGDVNSNAGLSFDEDNGGDTYIKIMPNEDLTVTLKPFDAGIGVGDEFETDWTQNTSGVEASVVLTDTLTFNGVLNTFRQNVKGKDEDKFGLKAGVTYTGETTSATAEFSTNTEDDANVTAAKEIQTALNVRGSMKMGDLTLSGEFTSITPNKFVAGNDDAGTGIFAKAAYNVGEVMAMDTTAYASFTMASEDLKYDGDYSNHEIMAKTAAKNGDVTVIKVGADMVWNGLTINHEMEMLSAGEDCWTDKDGKNTDSQMVFGTTVEFEF